MGRYDAAHASYGNGIAIFIKSLVLRILFMILWTDSPMSLFACLLPWPGRSDLLTGILLLLSALANNSLISSFPHPLPLRVDHGIGAVTIQIEQGVKPPGPDVVSSPL